MTYDTLIANMATFVRHALARREEDEDTYTWDTSNRDNDDVYWWYSRVSTDRMLHGGLTTN